VKSVTPALFTRIEIGPSASRHLATAAAACSRFEMSAPSAMAVPPASLIACTVSAQRASSRSSTPTAIPSCASRFEQAAPMPAAAPVTMATL
jgi:hypothetical protein